MFLRLEVKWAAVVRTVLAQVEVFDNLCPFDLSSREQLAASGKVTIVKLVAQKKETTASRENAGA